MSGRTSGCKGDTMDETIADVAFMLGQYQSEGLLKPRDSREWIWGAISIADKFDDEYGNTDWDKSIIPYIELLDMFVVSELDAGGFWREDKVW
jgi:hypothetical protein